MQTETKNTRTAAVDVAIILGFGVIGLFLVIRALGPNLARIPGDDIDTRFSIYILEHFFRWLSGIDKHYWTAQIFYPFPDTVAFSENFLGLAPLYAAGRVLGLDRDSAFQAWYLIGYALNYMAAGYVLLRLHFKPLAVGIGAFFFAFGLPMLALNGHVQLVQRFGIPFACLCMWQMATSPRFASLVGIAFWWVWQFYVGIYMGVFLTLLLAVLLIVAPFVVGKCSVRELLAFWPNQTRAAWQGATAAGRLITSLLLVSLIAALALLLWPYWYTTRLYGFERGWDFVITLLPTWRSYLLSDRAYLLWAPISRAIPLPGRSEENELFPGIAATLFILIAAAGLHLKRDQGDRRLVLFHVWAGLAIVALTLNVHGYSLYWFLWRLPGTNSVRAVGRIILMLMWPLAVLIAYAVDGLHQPGVQRRSLRTAPAVVLAGLLVAESAWFSQFTVPKAVFQARLSALHAQIPAVLPDRPILVLDRQPGQSWFVSEIEAMWLAQDLGWPVMNGYSGNFPAYYGPTLACSAIPFRIDAYMDFASIRSPAYYYETMKRIVPLGFDDCDPSWWTTKPRLSAAAGSLSEDVVSGLRLRLVWAKSVDGLIRAQAEVDNEAHKPIPAYSTSGNPFELSWRLSPTRGAPDGAGAGQASVLDFDIHGHSTALVTGEIPYPAKPGTYWLEVEAQQEGLQWPSAWGKPTAAFQQPIVVDANGNISFGSSSAP